MNTEKFELPGHLQPLFKKAKRLEKITLIYLFTVVIVMYLVTGNSQAMKVAWLEDLLSTVPAMAFLIASRYLDRQPNQKFPYGYHSVFTIAFLCGSVALFGIGCFVMIDSVGALVKMEHPSIGAITIFGHTIWMGYIMYAVLLYSSVPAIILGRKKLPLARALHNKVLFTDADTQKADWMTALAAIIGITGIGVGWWWADSVAAICIAVNIVYDGYTNLKRSVADLMSSQPEKTEEEKPDSLLAEIHSYMDSQPWVERFTLRFRENGQVYFGEIFVIPKVEENIVEHIEETAAGLKRLHWKIHDISITPVKEIK